MLTDQQIEAVTQCLKRRFDEDTIQDTLLALIKQDPILTTAKLTTYAFKVAQHLVYGRQNPNLAEPIDFYISAEAPLPQFSVSPEQEARAIARQLLQDLPREMLYTDLHQAHCPPGTPLETWKSKVRRAKRAIKTTRGETP